MTKNRKVALVTGASSGIGEALCRIFAREGYEVCLVARSEPKLQSLKQEIESQYSSQAHYLPIDLSIESSWQKLYEWTQEITPSLDVLVNNAGFGDYGPFEKTKLSKELQMVDLNIKALTALTKLFLKDMLKARRGQILNVASTAAFQPGPLMAVYYATKAYVLSFSEAIATELKGTGVSVTALCPGPTQSGFEQAAAIKKEVLLFKKNFIATSESVAEYAYQALKRRQTVAIHGKVNWLLVQSIRAMPRKITTLIVQQIQKSNDHSP